MTQTIASQQSSSIAEHLRAARERSGLSVDAASSATGLLRSYLAALEAGRRRPLPAEVDRLGRAYGADLSGLLPPRRPVDVDAGRVVVGGRERRVRDVSDEREVYAAYMFLLYSVRGAAPGQRIPLRSSDVELLMQVVGEDAETIEQRLVQLMGCTPAEATMLGTVLLRHRMLTAAVGAAAALSWVAVAAPGAPASARPPAQLGTATSSPALSGATSDAAYVPVDAVDGDAAAPVEDDVEGTWSPSYPDGRGADADG